MSFCTECGSGLGASDRFCSNCGSKIIDSEPTGAKKERKRLDVDQSANANVNVVPAQTNTRIQPVYGNGFKASVHCSNCGAKPGNGRKCDVCQIDR